MKSLTITVMLGNEPHTPTYSQLHSGPSQKASTLNCYGGACLDFGLLSIITQRPISFINLSKKVKRNEIQSGMCEIDHFNVSFSREMN